MKILFMVKNVVLTLLFMGAITLFAAPAPRMQERLILPEKIYAVPGIESNIYFANIFYVINPRNFVFDVKCKKGNNDEKRWHFTPKAKDVGTYDLLLKVWDENGVVAEGKSKLIVTPADAGKDKNVSLLIVGSSEISMKQAYPTHIYNLFKTPGNPKLTMMGETGPRKDNKLGEIRHEGYGGWSYLTFTTAGRRRVKGQDNMRENPFWNFKTKSLDFPAYFKKNTNGKTPDIVTISLGGNDVFRGTDESIDKMVADIRKRVITFVSALRKTAPKARIVALLLDYTATSQDAFGYNYGSTATKWQFRKNQAKFFRMMQLLSKEKPELKLECVLLNAATDNENNGYIYKMDANARNKAKVLRQSNALHPRECGYQQGADAFYGWMKYILHTEKKTNVKK